MTKHRRRASSGRRRADHALAAARLATNQRLERQHQLIELAPDGIIVHDGERILLVNDAAVRLSGAGDRAELVGMPIETILGGPYLKAAEQAFVGARSLSEQWPVVRDTLHRQGGGSVEVEIATRAYVENDRPVIHLVIRDISERLALEQTARAVDLRLQQAQKMNTVGALAGGVAHEVNNMMSVILGFSEIILGDEQLTAQSRTDVEEIAKAARRTAAVTAQLLAFSRRAFHHPAPLDVSQFLSGCEGVLRRLLGAGRRLILETGGDSLILADAGQLQQVLINLALNARDAMPMHGTLTLRSAIATVATNQLTSNGDRMTAGRYATMEVRDTGSGMNAATREQIFEPFFTTKPEGEGTGLGLAAAYGIIRQNHGFISVESEPGRGTAFTLYFPLIDGVAATRDERSGESRLKVPAGPLGDTLLVVEDEPAVRSITARGLTAAGFRVLAAADGAEALALIERNGPPDLVLTDIMMPGMSGSELGRLLRQRFPSLPVLYMSGYSPGDLHREGASPPARIMQKPFSPEELVRRVLEELEHHLTPIPTPGREPPATDGAPRDPHPTR